MTDLPIEGVLPNLCAAFHRHHNVVLSADPGVGKTTRVPLALLGEPWLAGKKIIMLEPRRLAAQRAAAYMARQIGERVGETVGYSIRGERRVGKQTRLEIVTEGILTRVLQSDPSLPDVGLLIYDEFHERSIHADLGLALALNVQEHLRPDLRLLVMSATLNEQAVASLLGDAPLVQCAGKMFPVQTHYLQRPHDGPVEPLVVSTILRALREETGDLLVFLPGQREIRRVDTLLMPEVTEAQDAHPGPHRESTTEQVNVYSLFGDAPPDQQQAALAPPPPGVRKVILSTSLAETSLTIDRVRVVIDSGLARSSRFDPRRGMSGLVTTPVSMASADQRRGRAGRQQPGVCYRLWTERQHDQLSAFAPAEILVADLTPLALELARWGTPEAEGLRFLDPLRPPHLAQARDLLSRLGALGADGRLTLHGKAMGELPVHPRFAHMLLRGKELGLAALACDIAALLEERDLLRGDRNRDIDIHSRWQALNKRSTRDKNAWERTHAQAMRLRELLGAERRHWPEDRIGVLVALAYPERVAKRRDAEGGRFQLAGGVGAVVPKRSILSREKYLAIADVDGSGGEVKVFLAEPITEEDIRKAFEGQISTRDDVHWDAREEAVMARRVTHFGTIELSEIRLSPPTEILSRMVIQGIRLIGLIALPWDKNSLSLRTRSNWLCQQRLVGSEWPDVTDEHLLRTLEDWLGPHLGGISRRAQLQRLDMNMITRSLFSYHQIRDLDRLAPTHLTVPTGSRIPVVYAPDVLPVLAVRLQEMFGQTETPTVGGGRIKVVLHLLSPARRPLAVTQDLPSFWKNAYPEVRKDARGRYPKHEWPENPLDAKPTKRAKRR